MSGDRHDDLGPAARDLLRHARPPRARTAAERERTTRAVRRLAAAPVVAGAFWLSGKGVALAAALAATGWGLGVAWHARTNAPAPAPPTAHTAPMPLPRSAIVRTAAVPRTPVAPPPAAPPEAQPTARPTVVRVPRGAPLAPAAPVVAPVEAAPPVVAAPSIAPMTAAPPEDEARTLERARALLRTDPAEALRLAESAPSSGRLIEERELIALEALDRLARGESLRARAESFIARFPRSLYAERVRRWLAR